MGSNENKPLGAGFSPAAAAGWVILDKPIGITSNQAVMRVRRTFNGVKTGHAGTLDPGASGVLPIAVGAATKTIAFVMDATKDYEFTLAWGAQTDTDDSDGTVIATSSHRPQTAAIEAVLPQFTGTILQTPPAYSAIKIRGNRAYDLARRGETPQFEPRPVEIHRLDLVENTAHHARFTATTGKGAYIRAMARDMGQSLGTVAHISALRRTRVGVFHSDNAISLDFFDKIDNSAAVIEALHPVLTALDDIPAFAITDDDAKRLRLGQKIPTPQPIDGIALALEKGVLVAIVSIDAGVAAPKRVFNMSDNP